MILWFWCPGFSKAVHHKRNITVVKIKNRTPEWNTRVTWFYCFYLFCQQRFHVEKQCDITFWPPICPLWLHHNNQQAMTEPSTPSVPVCVMEASQSVALPVTTVSLLLVLTGMTNEEEEAPLST